MESRNVLIIIGAWVVIVIVAMIVLSPPEVVGNKKTTQEIKRVELLSYERDVTMDDMEDIINRVKTDPFAMSFIDEVVWLIPRGENEHVQHALYYLYEYVRTGSEDICVSHEITHIGLYIEYDDLEMAQRYTEEALEYHDAWKKRMSELYRRFPHLYPNFNELLEVVDEVLPRLAAQNYDKKTLELIKYNEENEMC